MAQSIHQYYETEGSGSTQSSDEADTLTESTGLPPTYEEATAAHTDVRDISHSTITFGSIDGAPESQTTTSGDGENVASYLYSNGNTVRRTTFFGGNNRGLEIGDFGIQNHPLPRSTTAATGQAVNSRVYFGANNGGIQMAGTDVHNGSGAGGGNARNAVIFGANNRGIQASHFGISGKNMTIGPGGVTIEDK